MIVSASSAGKIRGIPKIYIPKPSNPIDNTVTIDVGDMNTVGTCHDDGGITAPTFPKVTHRMPDMAGIVFLENVTCLHQSLPAERLVTMPSRVTVGS